MSKVCLLYQGHQPIPYLQAWRWQKQLVAERISDSDLPSALLMLEHPAVYTLGQGSSLEFIKFSLDDPHIEWHRTERGGEVTYHSLGQLVVYPIFNLRHYQSDLHWYLRQLEEVIILTLANYGLKGDRRFGLTGVWLDNQKIAQIGIKVSRWITMHGFAINVNMDMAGFQQIIPCGIKDYTCTRISDYIPHITMAQVQADCLQKLAEVFDLVFTQSPKAMDHA